MPSTTHLLPPHSHDARHDPTKAAHQCLDHDHHDTAAPTAAYAYSYSQETNTGAGSAEEKAPQPSTTYNPSASAATPSTPTTCEPPATPATQAEATAHDDASNQDRTQDAGDHAHQAHDQTATPGGAGSQTERQRTTAALGTQISLHDRGGHRN